MPLGGAYGRVPATATALPNRNARFLLKHTVVFDPDASGADKEAARRWLARSRESVHRWGTDGVCVNFREPDLTSPENAYYGANSERLLSVKRRYDPYNVFGFR